MYFHGLLLGALSFLVIGIFHPIVIKAEYYFSQQIWPLFLIAGLALITSSLFVANIYLSVVLGLLGFSSLWSIGELREQAERVRKGWFPQNPHRADKKKDRSSQQ